jgi:hypothetical protein
MPNNGFEEQLGLWSEMGCCTKDENGEEKDVYVAWKKERDERLRSVVGDVDRNRARGMARLAARIGKMRLEETNHEAGVDS